MTNTTWIPIQNFLELKHLKMSTVYHFVKIREWRNGFVIRKNPTGLKARYVEANLDHYNQWLEGRRNEQRS